MGNKSSKMINDDETTKDGAEKLSTVSNEDLNKKMENKMSFIGSKVPEFKKEIYLPKTDEIEILRNTDMEGVFTLMYFFSGDFALGVLPELLELKKISTSPDSSGMSFNLLGVSTDSIDAHKAFSQLEQRQGGLKGLDIALVSDQTGELCKLFQIYDESSHSAYPSYVILDDDVNVVSKMTFDRKVGGDVTSLFTIIKYLMNEETSTSYDKTDDKKMNKNVSSEVNKIETCNDKDCTDSNSSVSK